MSVSGISPRREPQRWKTLYRMLTRPGPFCDPDWVPGPETITDLETSKILGAGGLGCEILKNLALSGFKDIHVIDMDTIDISNLNRQFLFRQSDVGKPKAEVAAAFVERRVKGVKITPYVGKIQDKDQSYYMQFKMIVCGLDSIEARRWINSMLVGMVDGENLESLKPLIDGGSEGFKGQVRVILPTLSSCIECQLDMHAPRAAVPLCTIATIPRQPQHCIEWAHQIAWGEHQNYMMYAGEEGVYTYTFAAEQKSDCPVCGDLAKPLVVDPESTLEDFILSLGELPEAQLKSPSLRSEAKMLYQRVPRQLEEHTRPNLKQKLKDLVADGDEVAVSDPAYTIDFRFRMTFK
ncbi:NEDD8 activating enzyme [Histoplasma capsulatum H143]|uniref:NEDD8-activating enzyme E1 catalytic subunit n=1 Tax=Ajellomyces capsulatus (strain H143) TaxID=544712 RepID=C6HA01_AJECH|nr:NEDD8 activating enzyme [Histoplasma capsulatum H143]